MVIETVEMLKQNVGNLEGCILHSDAGSTYTAYAYRELLLSFGIKQSMGKKLTCFICPQLSIPKLRIFV